MKTTGSRRTFIKGIGGAAAVTYLGARTLSAEKLPDLPGVKFAKPETFSFSLLQKKAQALAAKPFHKADIAQPDVLGALSYDQYQKIRYAADHTLYLDQEKQLPVQLFHLHAFAKEPVRMHLVEDGQSREVIYTPELFEMPDGHPARKLSTDSGFAGFRIMDPSLKSDWFAAMGASYFRSSAPFDQYGISARGIAINTALDEPEEFPRFTEYWLEKVEGLEDAALNIYGLLDGPSVAGAFRMKTARAPKSDDGRNLVMDIEAILFARTDIERLGIAPFSSMYWYGEGEREKAIDWRPEIHDSDGLALHTGAGERIWRPLRNPPRVMTNTYLDNNVKGFGLIQRDRVHNHYLDDGVFYEKRPSVWVEPLDDWGKGGVHLVEIPTADETFDNIVAYWNPQQKLQPGVPGRWRYRLTWRNEVPGLDLAKVVGTWTGIGGRPGIKRPEGVRKLVVDFEGPQLAKLGRDDGVEWKVTASRGTLSNIYNHPVVGQPGRWRAFVDVKAEGNDPVDLRGALSVDGRLLGEIWQYQHFPPSA